MATHHTTTRPRFPPGSISQGTYTLSQYLPSEDGAVRELHLVVSKVQPALPALLTALQNYHLHSADGWITTAG
jgi:chitinase domain-containing protein 1